MAKKSDVCCWEILVPTEKRVKTQMPNPSKYPPGSGAYKAELEKWKIANSYTTRFHKVWDAKVREISGGLTVLTPAKGQWVSDEGDLYQERMIPVRIACTQEQIEKIIDMTLEYYDQLAVMCIKISDLVVIKTREEKK